MKIAVPTRGTCVDDHFGHCAFYTLFTLSDDGRRVVARERVDSPQGCGCKSDIASVLAARGVRTMLAGNMGEGARNVLQRNGIAVVRGCSGEVETLVEEYLAGRLTDSGDACAHHHHGDAPCGDEPAAQPAAWRLDR